MREIVEQPDRRVDHTTAHLAYEMLVTLLGEVEHDGAVLDVHVLHDAELGEQVEGPVDRRAVQRGIDDARGLYDVCRRAVPVLVGVDERVEHRPPRFGDALSVRT
jgi:hypothetical protein